METLKDILVGLMTLIGIAVMSLLLFWLMFCHDGTSVISIVVFGFYLIYCAKTLGEVMRK